MATIVNNPGPSSDSGSAGWIVAAVVIIGVILVALFVWPGYARNTMGGGQEGDTNINVTVPDMTPGGGGGTGGDAGGGAAQ